MSASSPARVWLALFGAGFAAIAVLLVVTLFTPTPYGDLSRTGMVSDAEFGWTMPQPQAPEPALANAPLDQADVLVIGDSFSMSRHWQSVLVQDGLRVITASWGQYGNALCPDFDAWIRRAGFRGRLVIVESVERMLSQRAAASARCERMTPAAAPLQPAPYHPPQQRPSGFELNWDARLMSGWTTWLNTRRALRSDDDVLASADTVVRPVPDGCALFSHRACDKALFFDEDVSKGPLTAVDLENVRKVSAAIRVPLLWLVVPNKTTVYVDPAHSARFGEDLERAGLGPDLFSFAQAQRARARDFYFPNDTHLSRSGELALGQHIRSAVQARMASPAASATR